MSCVSAVNELIKYSYSHPSIWFISIRFFYDSLSYFFAALSSFSTKNDDDDERGNEKK